MKNPKHLKHSKTTISDTKAFNYSTLRKTRPNHFTIKTLTKPKKPQTAFFTAVSPQPIQNSPFNLGMQTEMTKTIASLIEHHALLDNTIAQLESEHSSLQAEYDEMQSNIANSKTTKDKFAQYIKDYQKLENEFTQQMDLLQRSANELQVLLAEREQYEPHCSYYNSLDKEHRSVQNEITLLQNRPKDKEIVIAEERERSIENDIQRLNEDLEVAKTKLEENISNKESVLLSHRKLQADMPREIEDINASIKESELKRGECEVELNQLKQDGIDLDDKISTTQTILAEYVAEQQKIQNEIQQQQEHTNALLQEIESLTTHQQDKLTLTNEQITQLIGDKMLNLYIHYHNMSLFDIVNSNLINLDKYLKSCILTHSIEPFTHVSTLNSTLYKDIYNLLCSYNSSSSNTNIKSTPPNTIDKIVNDLYDKYISNAKRSLASSGATAPLDKVNEMYSASGVRDADIKSHFESKISQEIQFTRDNMRKIIENCLDKSVIDDNITYNNKQIISLNALYNNKIFTFSKGSFTINNDLLSNDNSLQVITAIKYHNTQITKIHFQNNIDYDSISSLSIIQLLYALYTNSACSLQSFSFTNCTNISHSILSFISELIPNLSLLKILSFENDELNNDKCAIICKAIAPTQIVALCLKSNSLSSQSGVALGDLLNINKNISRLYLSYNMIHGDGLKHLLQCMEMIKREIHLLDLSYNNLTTEDFITLSDYLKSNPELNGINLCGNIIEMSSCVEMGVAIAKARNIKVLNFSNANIIPEAFPVLFQNVYVEELLLDDNPLGEIGCLMLAKILSSSKTVKKLSVKNIKVSEIGLIHLLGYIKVNESLKEIHLEMNLISNKGLNTAVELSNGTYCKIYFTQKLVGDGDKDFFRKYGDLGNVILVD